MKTLPLLAAFLLTIVTALAASPADEKKIAAFEAKAKATKIQLLEFKEIPTAAALMEISTLSGIKVVYQQAAGETAKITVPLKNIPADEALRYVTSLANLKFRFEADCVRVLPLDAKP